MSGAIRPVADVFTLGTAELIKPATGIDVYGGGNPTGNPAIAQAGTSGTASNLLAGQTPEEEQASRLRAQAAASALSGGSGNQSASSTITSTLG